MPSKELLNCPRRLLMECATRLKGHWIRRMLAITSSGVGVTPKSDKAVKFCALGIIENISHEWGADEEVAEEARKLLGKQVGNPYIFPWNDNVARNEEEVINAFRKASELP